MEELPNFSCNYPKKGIWNDVTLVLGRKDKYLNYIQKGKTYLGGEQLVSRLVIDVRVTSLIVAFERIRIQC